MQSDRTQKSRPTGAAFLLAQLGAHAADRFAERIKNLRIRPHHAGMLRFISRMPSCNQRALANRLGVLPSRMVVLIDEMTKKGLVQRRRSTKDRRHSELVLTKRGQRVLEKLSHLATKHEADLLAGLTANERETLASLGRKIVQQQGLMPDVHPGFRKL